MLRIKSAGGLTSTSSCIFKYRSIRPLLFYRKKNNSKFVAEYIYSLSCDIMDIYYRQNKCTSWGIQSSSIRIANANIYNNTSHTIPKIHWHQYLLHVTLELKVCLSQCNCMEFTMTNKHTFSGIIHMQISLGVICYRTNVDNRLFVHVFFSLCEMIYV